MANGNPSLSSDSILLLEQSLLRVPVESMRKTYRTASKGADKELTVVETSIKKIKSNTTKREDKLKAVEGALKRLEALKAKVRAEHLCTGRARLAGLS
jgi:hypothetical protein